MNRNWEIIIIKISNWIGELVELLWYLLIWASLPLEIFFLCLLILTKILFRIILKLILIVILMYRYRSNKYYMNIYICWNFFKKSQQELLLIDDNRSNRLVFWLDKLEIIVCFFLVVCLFYFKIILW